MAKSLKNQVVAENLVRDLVTALRDRQEARGENLTDTNSYTIGYIGSMLACIMAESPKARAYVRGTVSYIKENA
jgi:hypothetical protein